MNTHYIPKFTVKRQGQQQAVCGSFVDAKQFSTEPDCPMCIRWLSDERQDDEATLAALRAEFPEDAERLRFVR